MTLSKSPERDTFQREGYIKRQMEKGTLESTETQEMLDWYKSLDQLKAEKEADPAWQKDNLEYDLRSTEWILKKVRDSEEYAQNLYAAMCNNEFMKLDVLPILKEQKWSCSWRYAGGIVADMLEKGDYVDWYCSGIRDNDLPDIGFVAESVVTDEIRADLKTLGWLVVTDNFDND